jgi:beta-glucanase (GH16 family)
VTRRLVVLAILAALLVSVPAQASPTGDRLAALEARLSALEARVTALEAGWTAAPTPAVTASPAPVASATAVPTPTPTTNPTLTPTAAPSPTPFPGWALVFRDDFDTLDTSRYVAYLPGWPDTRTQWGDTTNGGLYTGFDSLSTANGILTIRLYRDANNRPRSVAFIPQLPGGQDQTFGRYEVRFRSSVPATGWKVAWLQWPASGVWPRDGEIDFPEGNLTGTIHAFMHRQNGTSGSDQDAYSTGVTFVNWHTAVLEWTPTRCEFFLDGVSIGKATSRIPNTPMHWVIQSETALDGSIPASEAAMQIDWLAAWRYAP